MLVQTISLGYLSNNGSSSLEFLIKEFSLLKGGMPVYLGIPSWGEGLFDLHSIE